MEHKLCKFAAAAALASCTAVGIQAWSVDHTMEMGVSDAAKMLTLDEGKLSDVEQKALSEVLRRKAFLAILLLKDLGETGGDKTRLHARVSMEQLRVLLDK